MSVTDVDLSSSYTPIFYWSVATPRYSLACTRVVLGFPVVENEHRIRMVAWPQPVSLMPHLFLLTVSKDFIKWLVLVKTNQGIIA